MGIIIYLIGYALCFFILNKIRAVGNQNTRKDVIITILISLTSWVGFLFYGGIYFVGSKFLKIIVLFFSLASFAKEPIQVVTKGCDVLTINPTYTVTQNSNSKGLSVDAVILENVRTYAHKLTLNEIRGNKDVFQNSINDRVRTELLSNGYSVDKLELNINYNPPKIPLTIGDYVLYIISGIALVMTMIAIVMKIFEVLGGATIRFVLST